jgi:uncharacterized protein YdhG (YjbR/CyaY superfamily)
MFKGIAPHSDELLSVITLIFGTQTGTRYRRMCDTIRCTIQSDVRYNQMYGTIRCKVQSDVRYNQMYGTIRCTIQSDVRYNQMYGTIRCTIQSDVRYNQIYDTTRCTIQSVYGTIRCTVQSVYGTIRCTIQSDVSLWKTDYNIAEYNLSTTFNVNSITTTYRAFVSCRNIEMLHESLAQYSILYNTLYCGCFNLFCNVWVFW